MSEPREREGAERGDATGPIARKAAREAGEPEGGPELRPEEPLKRHGDALLDGSGSRQGEEDPGPEEPSQ